MGVELCGQPLKWDDVRPFKLQFGLFDVSKTGKLSADDLKKYSDKMEQVKARVAKAREAVAAGDPLGIFHHLPVGKGETKRSIQAEMAAQEEQDLAVARLQARIRGRNSRKGSFKDSGVPKAGKAARAVAPA